ncbi:MAG: FAD-dependent oxidoreductase [Alphaproteobacteria bacterium]|nr:FAD-dependent oxidoreductase [Alphaproteobacteria bacterium]
MHVIVIGAGLAGVTAAWYLRQAGHDVTVIERREAAGLETSFANAGLVVPSQPDPWNAPGVLKKLLHYLGKEDAPFLLRPSAVPGMLGWGLRFLRNSRPEAWKRNTLAAAALAQYSLARLRALREATAIEYPFSAAGSLKIFRDQEKLDQQIDFARLLAPHDIEFEVLGIDQTLALEPALDAVADRLVGSVYFPGDEFGDAHRFTQALAQLATAAGVTFRFGESVMTIEADGNRFTAVRTSRERIQGHAVILAAAAWSPALAAPLGIRLWINPVKGYSATVPLAGWNAAPRMAVVDDTLKIVASPIGGNLRMGGTAEFAGWDTTLNERRARNILSTAITIFPDLADQAERAGVTYWTGLRPVSPDGSPYVGATPVPGVYVNAGHGPLGWTFACGSGKLVADIVIGASPEIDPAPFSPTRLS